MDGFELLGRKLKVRWASFANAADQNAFDAASARASGGEGGAGGNAPQQPTVPIGVAANLAWPSTGAATPADAGDGSTGADDQRCVVLTNMVSLSEVRRHTPCDLFSAHPANQQTAHPPRP